MPSSDKTTSSTTTQKVELPAWVDQGGQDNYKVAQDIASQPYVPYTGALTAGINNDYRGAGYANLNEGQTWQKEGTSNRNNAAQSVLSGGSPSSVTAQQVGAPTSVKDIFASSIGKGDIANYMNPYEDDVVKSAQLAGDQSIAASQRANSDAAISAGAFGSSRHGVTEGVTAAQGAQDIAQTVGGIRSAGFNTALSAAQADAGRKDAASLANQNKDMSFQDLLARINAGNQSADLSAQQGNQSAGLQYNSQRLGAASQFASNGAQDFATSGTIADRLNQDALLAQSTQQSGLDRTKAAWQEQQDYPTEQLNLRLAALGMTPYGKTTTGTSNTTESGGDNPFLSILGGLSSAKGLFNFSDPKLKKNVRTEGTGPNGLTVKSFDYRDDTGLDLPRGRQIGYMADEVERKMPEAVRRVPIGDGKTARQVDYGMTGTPGLFGFSKGRKGA